MNKSAKKNPMARNPTACKSFLPMVSAKIATTITPIK